MLKKLTKQGYKSISYQGNSRRICRVFNMYWTERYRTCLEQVLNQLQFLSSTQMFVFLWYLFNISSSLCVRLFLCSLLSSFLFSLFFYLYCKCSPTWHRKQNAQTLIKMSLKIHFASQWTKPASPSPPLCSVYASAPGLAWARVTQWASEREKTISVWYKM